MPPFGQHYVVQRSRRLPSRTTRESTVSVPTRPVWIGCSRRIVAIADSPNSGGSGFPVAPFIPFTSRRGCVHPSYLIAAAWTGASLWRVVIVVIHSFLSLITRSLVHSLHSSHGSCSSHEAAALPTTKICRCNSARPDARCIHSLFGPPGRSARVRGCPFVTVHPDRR